MAHNHRLAWLLATALPVAAAWASGGGLDQAVALITMREWMATLLLSVFSGLVALLQRIKASQEAAIKRTLGLPHNADDIICVSGLLYTGAHMLGAVFAGMVTFLASEAQHVLTNGYAVAAAIALASYGGAKVAEKWAPDRRFAPGAPPPAAPPSPPGPPA